MRGLLGTLLGLVFGYALWGGGDPAYIENVRASEEIAVGGAYVMNMLGSGQVVVFHGFADNLDVCLILEGMLESEGGTYDCVPAQLVARDDW